jgi:hypothetical protein
MMVISPGIIGQVAWFILIDKRRCRAGICAASYKALPDGVFMPSCHFGNSPTAFYPLIRPLVIVQFARLPWGHRAGCCANQPCRISNSLILLSFIL